MRKIFIIILACVAVLLAGYAGYRGYTIWNQNHLMGLAHDFLAKSDTRNAVLCLQKVIRSNPRNLKAARMMADLSERARSPSAVLWRSRVVELNPKSLEDRLALVRTALRMNDLATATNALAAVDAADQKTASYQNIAGTVAAAANEPALAENHFLEATRLEPQNPAPQMNLAVVRLHGTNEAAMAEARLTLQKLSENPTNAVLRCQALRELVLDATRHKHYATALACSQKLLEETNSVFTDKLLRLSILKQTRSDEFKAGLNKCQQEAADSPSETYELARWQMATSPRDALTWLRSLPKSNQTNQPVALLVAECYNQLHDWRGLQAWLEPQNWGSELEFIRHAFLSRALRGQQLMDSSQAEWQLALKNAPPVKQSLYTLLGFAGAWGWQSEGEQLLWDIFNRYPGEKAATQTLVRTLFAEGRTRSLMQIFKQQLNRSPGDLEAKNNLAMAALLLDAQELNPDKLADEAYHGSPTNSAYASTYAFSLYLQGKKSEALKVMTGLKPRQLENPSVAGYYGLILEANDDRARARPYLERALNVKVLPEEEKLFKNALAKAKQ